MGVGKGPSRGKIVVDEDQDEVRLAGGATCPVLCLSLAARRYCCTVKCCGSAGRVASPRGIGCSRLKQVDASGHNYAGQSIPSKPR